MRHDDESFIQEAIDHLKEFTVGRTNNNDVLLDNDIIVYFREEEIEVCPFNNANTN